MTKRTPMPIGVFPSVAIVSVALPSAGPTALNVAAAAQEASMPASITEIPTSVRTEHELIHRALEEATTTPGRVGAAARALARVLHPHFVREEEIALPPLGVLASLAVGVLPPDTAAILTMTDALRQELPRMLDEHTRIREAVEDLRVAARAEQSDKHEQLAHDLALHAQTEEEVLYPAAVLVGDVIRARLAGK